VIFTTIENLNLSDESLYQRGYEFTLGLNDVRELNVWRYENYAGKTVRRDEFARISVSYRWQ